MSWVAEAKATISAKTIRLNKLYWGSLNAIPTSAKNTESCANNIQLRLRPRIRVRIGIGIRSTKGDHTHLKPYASATQLIKPIVLLSIPASLSQNDNPEKTSMRGSPDEKPKNSIERMPGCQ